MAPDRSGSSTTEGLNERLRILLVSEFYPPMLGGLEIHVENLALELTGRGHLVHVATLGHQRSVTTQRGIPVHRLTSLSARVGRLHESADRPFHPPLPDPSVRGQLRRIIRDLRPDVVHGHNWMAASVPRGPYALVMTAHDYAWVCPRRTLLRADHEICAGPSLGRCLPCATQQFGPVRAPMVDLATRVGRRMVRPDAHLCVSRAVADAIAPVATGDVIVVPNFTQSDVEDPGDAVVPGLPEGPFALFAGSTHAHKGAEVLRRAWSVDPAPCPLFVASLEAQRRPWPAQVVVAQLDRRQMATAWARATVAVVPSLWPDPCPTVALEAMAAGVPVVASKVGGLVDMVTDGVEGYLVPPGDADAVRNAVDRIVSDPQRREAMGDAARKRADSFSGPAVAARIEGAYRHAISRHHG